MTCVIGATEETILRNVSSPFSPRKNSRDDDKTPMPHAHTKCTEKGRELIGNSLWLSRKMLDDGCTLGQTLQIMQERCKDCEAISPMICVEQCETWTMKKELLETGKLLSQSRHGLGLVNALKNKRRIAILGLLYDQPQSVIALQKKLRDHGFPHSQKTIYDYLKPLIKAGLVKPNGFRFKLTLYGHSIRKAVKKHDFTGQLPVHSRGHEEKILRNLLEGRKTRADLLRIAPVKSLSRILKRLTERRLVFSNASGDHVFYFRTKRALRLERLTPTQKKICDTIPKAGISAPALSKHVGINLRRTYKYLRNLRGKKLVFRRHIPSYFELTAAGRTTAEFLDEIAHIK